MSSPWVSCSAVTGIHFNSFSHLFLSSVHQLLQPRLHICQAFSNLTAFFFLVSFSLCFIPPVLCFMVPNEALFSLLSILRLFHLTLMFLTFSMKKRNQKICVQPLQLHSLTGPSMHLYSPDASGAASCILASSGLALLRVTDYIVLFIPNKLFQFLFKKCINAPLSLKERLQVSHIL